MSDCSMEPNLVLRLILEEVVEEADSPVLLRIDDCICAYLKESSSLESYILEQTRSYNL